MGLFHDKHSLKPHFNVAICKKEKKTLKSRANLASYLGTLKNIIYGEGFYMFFVRTAKILVGGRHVFSQVPPFLFFLPSSLFLFYVAIISIPLPPTKEQRMEQTPLSCLLLLSLIFSSFFHLHFLFIPPTSIFTLGRGSKLMQL